MWLQSGMPEDHGGWRVSPEGQGDQNIWRAYWWNGTADPNLMRSDVGIGIGVFELESFEGDYFYDGRGQK